MQTLNNIDPNVLGDRLKSAREKAQISTKLAARIISSFPESIVAIESGKSRIRATELIKLARAYDCSVSSLVAKPLEGDPIALYKNGEITEGQLAEALGVSRLEAREMVVEEV